MPCVHGLPSESALDSDDVEQMLKILAYYPEEWPLPTKECYLEAAIL